jgi:hypothetical protein
LSAMSAHRQAGREIMGGWGGAQCQRCAQYQPPRCHCAGAGSHAIQAGRPAGLACQGGPLQLAPQRCRCPRLPCVL